MQKISKIEVDFINNLCLELMTELKAFYNDTKDKDYYYCYANKHRASFNRLRVELNKRLVQIKNKIYS